MGRGPQIVEQYNGDCRPSSLTRRGQTTYFIAFFAAAIAG